MCDAGGARICIFAVAAVANNARGYLYIPTYPVLIIRLNLRIFTGKISDTVSLKFSRDTPRARNNISISAARLAAVFAKHNLAVFYIIKTARLTRRAPCCRD